MEKVFLKLKILFIMEFLLIGLNMGKDNKNLLMVTHIKENIKMEDLMDLALINGQVMQFIKDPLKMVLDMVRVNGLKIKRNILEIMFKDLKRDMVSYTFQVAIFTKEISLMIKDKDMDKCFGQMDLSTKGNGRMAFKMEKGKYIYQGIKL